MSTSSSPRAAVFRGLLAGAAGTGVMTAAQMVYMKATDGKPSNTPGEVGKRIIEGVLQREVPETQADALNNAMHWLYGTSWGMAYGITAGGRRPAPLRSGVGFGLAVWGASLIQLPAMKLAPPVWEYEPATLAPDVGFHLAYGVGVATAFRALGG